jgi:hypothetical protein
MARYADVTAAIGEASGEELKRPRGGSRASLAVRGDVTAEAVWSDVNKRQRAKAARLVEEWQGRLRRQVELSKSFASLAFALLLAHLRAD